MATVKEITTAMEGKMHKSVDALRVDLASLRAAEIEADAILMAKKGVDGVYDSDPAKNPNAKKFDKLDYIEVIQRKLNVMDSTANSLCMDNSIPIVVFNIDEPGNILRAALGEDIGTLVGGKK